MSPKTPQRSFELIHEGRTQILIDPHFYSWLQETGIEQVQEIIDRAQIDPHRGGRRGCRVFSARGRENHSLVVRRYAHGGLLRRFLGELFVVGSRPFHEMTMTEKIRATGVPTVQVVAALRHRRWGPFYRGELITREIPGAKDLVSFTLGFGADPPRWRRSLRYDAARQAGKAVRFMHDQGVYHGDLNLKNLLIRAGQHPNPEIYIIDFDRSKIQDSLTIQQRMKNLLRLNRSAEKWKTRGLSIRYTDKARFFQAYAGGDSDITQTMRRYLKRARVHTWWHRFGWRADHLFNPSSE